jgi:hypothetical protein
LEIIIFKGNVKLNDGTNLDVVPGGRRFSPNLRLASPELGTTRWGLTVMEPEKRISSGMEGVCRFRMLGVREFEPLAKHLVVGLEFTLSQGPIVLGSGVIIQLEEGTMDENT